MDDNQLLEIPEEDRKRIQKATSLLAGYINFMRWAGNFRQNEIQKHPRHANIVMLSPLQSSRFAYSVQGSTLLLGTQHFELAWLTVLPFEVAYVSDRLYLSVSGVRCLEVGLPPITIGLWFNHKSKLEEISACSYVTPVEMTVIDGVVTDVGRPLGLGIPVKKADVVAALQQEAKEAMNQTDLTRFF